MGESEHTVLLCSRLLLVGKKSKGEWQLFERAMTACAQQKGRGALRPRVLPGGPTWDDTLTLTSLWAIPEGLRWRVLRRLWVPLGTGLFSRFPQRFGVCWLNASHALVRPEPLPILEKDHPGGRCCAGTYQSQADFAIRDRHGGRGRCPASPLGPACRREAASDPPPMGSDFQEASWQP